jgi:hypothetical protein
MVGSQGRLVIAAVAGSWVLAGGVGGAGGVASGSPGAACHGGSSGFAISFARNVAGSTSPVAAAGDFVRHWGAGGFGSPSSVWTIAPPPYEPGAVTVTDGAEVLHTVKLENGRWAVDSGKRCS